MRAVRFSIAGLMGVVLIAAIGLAALRSQSGLGGRAAALNARRVLRCSGRRSFVGRARARGGWIGFAVFGWGYMSAAFWPSDRWPTLPTESLLEAMAPRLVGVDGPFPRPMGGMGGGMVGKGGGAPAVMPLAFGSDRSFRVDIVCWRSWPRAWEPLVGSRLFGAARDEAEGASTGSESVDTARSRKRWIVSWSWRYPESQSALIAITGSMIPPGAWRAGFSF